MPLAPGTRLGPYEVIAPLGAGGMGEVYRARDTRLGRDVAVKVLPADLGASAERLARFEREARTVAALNHPNIVVLHSVEDVGGVRFLTMELVEGQNLAEILTPDGLTIERVVELGIGLADALAAAHEQNVVHRDLKPANVMVTRDGRVKVLDFGLAKLSDTESGTDQGLTQAPTIATPLSSQGQVMGTVPYMAPEQIRGGDVDARTDLFALGIVLYELASGSRPFTGGTLADISSAILRDPPVPLGSRRTDLPLDLERIIGRCLEKEPRARFQTALDVANELRRLQKGLDRGDAMTVSQARPVSGLAVDSRETPRRWPAIALVITTIALSALAGTLYLRGRATSPAADAVPVSVEAPEHSIAVLPFADLSPTQDQQYFSDGISEDLLNLLSRVSSLQVTARTSSFSFRGKEVTVPEIGRQLHVRHVLEGSVRRMDNQVRITAQLIDARTGTQVWSQAYDRTLDDVFAVQNEIAAGLVDQLRVRLLGPAPRARETSPEAYALYLEAVQVSRQRTAEGYARGDSLLRRVVAIDPQYAPAWVHLSNNLLNEANIGLVPREAGYSESRAAAARALEIDPGYARAYSSLGTLDLFSGDLAGAARNFERALELDPTDPTVLGNSGAVLKSLGRIEEALAMDEAIVRRDPVNPVWLFNLANAYGWAGRYDRSIATMRTVLSLAPNYAAARLVMGESLLKQGNADLALAEFQQEVHPAFKLIGLPMALHALGRRAEADSMLARLIAEYGADVTYDIAYIHAFRGDSDRAFEWLDKAAAANDPSLSLVLVENLFASLHDDPRWPALLARIGKSPEELAKIEFQPPIERP